MNPTDLLLFAPFASLAPGVYTDDSILQRFALQKQGAGESINRLTSKTWAHTFEGYVQAGIELRCGTLFDALGGSNVSGAVLEHYAENLLGNIDWTSQPVVNGAVTSTASASFALQTPASGFKLTSAAAGDCYIEIAGPFTWSNLDVVYSVAAFDGPVFIGCNVDGTITTLNANVTAWQWLTAPDTTGAAPAAFRVGFTAAAAGETRSFAWPQVEELYGTSPILNGQRGGEAFLANGAQVVQTGRVNLEIDVHPSVDENSDLTTFELLYIDASNAIRFIFDSLVGAYRLRVTVGGVDVTSDPIQWSDGRRLRLWIEFGNGRPRVAYKYQDEATVCASDSMTTTQVSVAAGAQLLVPGRPQVGVKQFGGVYQAINFWPNADRPDWVGCVCGS